MIRDYHHTTPRPNSTPRPDYSSEYVHWNDMKILEVPSTSGSSRKDFIRKRKSSRTNNRSISLKRSAKQKKAFQALAKEFLGHKLSAAGVSYVVSSKTKSRRRLWLLAVIASICFMGYMTVNVVQEYLGYPKSLFREGNIRTNLTFPAVTFCSLNPIMNQHIEESSIAKLLYLKRMLRGATTVETDKKKRDDCYLDPLCQWSWFSETCNCVENPCITEFCLPGNSTHCMCSFKFCKDDRYISCSSEPGEQSGKSQCYCSNAAVYKKWPVNPVQSESELISSIGDLETEHVVGLIRNASTYDLADVEEALLPTTDDLVEYGLNFDDLIISCSFEGARCYRENFTVLNHPKYGKCYMFNYLGIQESGGETPIDVYNYGSSSGLLLILHVNARQKTPLLTREIGVRVVVHDPHDLPFVAEYGTNVRPLDMSAVEVTLNQISRLGKPWGACRKKETFRTSMGIPAQYSTLGCEKDCRHRHLTKTCNCTRRQYLRGSVVLKTTTSYAFCNISDPNQYVCMSQIIKDIEKGKILCHCEPPCKETLYRSTVSSSRLNEHYFRTIKAIRTLVTTEDGKFSITNTTGDKSMVGVKVYYSTLQVDNDREVATYSWETLVANIGGNLGFFMGLTLVTFVEVIEFLWDLLKATINRTRTCTPVQLSGNKNYKFSCHN